MPAYAKAMLFHVPQFKIFAVNEGKSRFQHSFGGPSAHKGTTPRGHKQPLHLLYTLDLHDPAVGLRISGIQNLPLYYGFVYNGAPVA